jgi:hypothetical protein
MKSSQHRSGPHSVIIFWLCFVDFMVDDCCAFDILINIRRFAHSTSPRYLSGTLLNFAVVFLTGLIKISRPSTNVFRRRKPGSSPLVFRSILSMYKCPPSSCSLQAERNCFPCGPPPQLPASSLLGGLLMARLKRLLGSLRSAYQSRCVMK